MLVFGFHKCAQLRAELQFQRQQVQDVAKVAEYYRALVQEARDERDAAIQRAEKAKSQARALSDWINDEIVLTYTAFMDKYLNK